MNSEVESTMFDESHYFMIYNTDLAGCTYVFIYTYMRVTIING